MLLKPKEYVLIATATGLYKVNLKAFRSLIKIPVIFQTPPLSSLCLPFPLPLPLLLPLANRSPRVLLKLLTRPPELRVFLRLPDVASSSSPESVPEAIE
jgi:hypothetical protein